MVEGVEDVPDGVVSDGGAFNLSQLQGLAKTPSGILSSKGGGGFYRRGLAPMPPLLLPLFWLLKKAN